MFHRRAKLIIRFTNVPRNPLQVDREPLPRCSCSRIGSAEVVIEILMKRLLFRWRRASLGPPDAAAMNDPRRSHAQTTYRKA
ncbi:hypothetical protein ZHAS_00002124 [Anopheles sinensis]|uniref:Uncharacterized protein n=1 Tax=Anopheles sinensis TaxID=74873 RepID=A0A084VBT6_ANOSI|nr:hypothetical protein ZHAS_00002124 [Anopheles sinensis]